MLVASGILILSAALMVLFSLVGWISAYLNDRDADPLRNRLSGRCTPTRPRWYSIRMARSRAFAAAVFGVVSQIGAAIIVSVLVGLSPAAARSPSASCSLCVCVVTFVLIAWWHYRHGNARALKPL